MIISKCSAQFQACRKKQCCEKLKVREIFVNILQMLYDKQWQSFCILKQNEKKI